MRHRTDFGAYRLSAIRVAVRQELRHALVGGYEALQLLEPVLDEDHLIVEVLAFRPCLLDHQKALIFEIERPTGRLELG